MYKIFSHFLNLLWPIECFNCHGLGFHLCPQCREIIKPHINLINNLPEQNHLDLVISCFNYRGTVIKKVIDNFKFHGLENLGKILIDLICQNQELTKLLIVNRPIFCPIPLHRSRLRQRGFNQSLILTKELEKKFNLSCIELLKRKANTKHQVGLDKDARLKNIYNAFVINKKMSIDQNTLIILVDDVVTTGSTANEAARTLKQAGYKKIWLLAIAHE